MAGLSARLPQVDSKDRARTLRRELAALHRRVEILAVQNGSSVSPRSRAGDAQLLTSESFCDPQVQPAAFSPARNPTTTPKMVAAKPQSALLESVRSLLRSVMMAATTMTRKMARAPKKRSTLNDL